MKVKLDGVMETLLITLDCRARDYQKKNSVLKDALAYKIKSQIDYDFSIFDHSTMSYYGTIARAKVMDDEVRKFIQAHPDCVIVSIGCGLDTRFFRVDNGQITWYNVDFDDVIDLREKLIEKNDRVLSIRGSALEEDWTKEVSRNGKELLLISEGVLMYFQEEEVKTFLEVLTSSFEDFTLHLDMLYYKVVGMEKKHDSLKYMSVPFSYGVKDGKELVALNPKLHWVSSTNFTVEMKHYLKGWRVLLIPVMNVMNNRLCIYTYGK